MKLKKNTFFFCLFYLRAFDCFSSLPSSSEDEAEYDFCSDVEATASEPERDLKNKTFIE
jgi:hypothetical protein